MNLAAVVALSTAQELWPLGFRVQATAGSADETPATADAADPAITAAAVEVDKLRWVRQTVQPACTCTGGGNDTAGGGLDYACRCEEREPGADLAVAPAALRHAILAGRPRRTLVGDWSTLGVLGIAVGGGGGGAAIICSGLRRLRRRSSCLRSKTTGKSALP